MEKGEIVNIDQVYKFMNSLKKLKRGYVTNIFNVQRVEDNLKENKELIFEYCEGSYLNILCEDSGFYRLYFFIVDLEHYEIGKIEKTVVCDIFISQDDVIFGKIKNKLYECAFTKYDCIEKWILSSCDRVSPIRMEGYIVDYEKKMEAMDEVLSSFDYYTDYLPNRSEINRFMQEKNFINIYEAKDNKYVGSLIYTEKKRMAVLEFYFVVKEHRGKGIGFLLHDCFYQRVGSKGYKIISYIHENNLISIRIHQKYGYQRTNIKKVVFICNS